MIRRWWPVVVLIVVVTTSGWLLWQAGDATTDHPVADRPVADAFMNDFTTVGLDEQGRQRYRLSAARLEHFSEEDVSELQQPRAVFFRESEQPLQIESEQGRMLDGGEVVLLSGVVHLWRDRARGGRQLDVVTSELRVVPDRQYAETTQAVTLRTAHGETHGIGLHAFAGEQRFVLLSRVRSVYDPRSYQ